MNIKGDNIEIDDSFKKFIDNLIKCLDDFLENLKNYYQVYLSTVLTANLKESSNYEHRKVETKYNTLTDGLTEFITVITKDSAEVQQKVNEIKSLKENYKFYKNLLQQVSDNGNNSDMIDNIISEFEQIEGQLNELVPVHNNKIVKLDNFKHSLKDGTIEYQSYSGQQSFSIPIIQLIRDLKKAIQNIQVNKELKNYYSILKESLHEIQSLSSYPDLMPLQSAEDTLTDVDSLHVTPRNKKRKEHLTMGENNETELAMDIQNMKKSKRDSDFNDDLAISNSNDEQVLFDNEQTYSHSKDQVKDIIDELLMATKSNKNRYKLKNGKQRVSSSRFILESIMPDGASVLIDIDDQDTISKEYYETTLRSLDEQLQKINEIDNYLIIHENDKLCKKYHGLKKELNQLEEKLHKTKKQISDIKNIRKMSGDYSILIKENLTKEREELTSIEHEINDKKAEIKKIQKSIRKLDKKDYDLQNQKHILYNGMRKLIGHWLLQIENELDQGIDVERLIELQNDFEEANKRMNLIEADINDMYLSYSKRKKSRISTEFDYDHFCENSTFTECLYRYDKSAINDDNDNAVNSEEIVEYTIEE